ncbi:uncharacterized protein [Typha angustifolia]|uniref:uncharacterized protein isoform X1 n=1 Tax=Typha angustifolia TaxID=59011 RepID=UPI003C2FB2F0
MRTTCCIQGQILEVTVVGGSNLRNTEWFRRQHPYAILQYGGTQIRTQTCSGGGRRPYFDEKFQITLIEGLLHMNISVWNSKTLRPDIFIGRARVNLRKVISEGYDDLPCMLHTENSRYAGELKLIMRYSRQASQQTHVPEHPPHIHGQPCYPTGVQGEGTSRRAKRRLQGQRIEDPICLDDD